MLPTTLKGSKLRQEEEREGARRGYDSKANGQNVNNW